ncbi:hypothetical protein GLOIN_2v1556714 [Rhizophagus irregularis DAOM 181602=DAOM 197198]|uniref:Uncharacterized protein n=1 Tax=Rhizophagus irregularis (strain DAOM 181602 / DAOM 197198 / MUCL 43194) TaxID=747089 RepID=A0A2P4QFT0_RHIID|nr:hypothetical protein GLOIN_2v1556714 [Rhizophagus irregularis DAOM 181602=DAOM 197198]POG76476.1 hypothetical protein GLOIN_2v1556714 [Rhizophagus irregularis DAOM 181602=DAOM 197198]|eukprot:XP_025183342.1 hypothetical protein GLOIN_2v1556714 [Rhizophagus irregularis DAOM 181602=DAOM 197198]
MEWTFNVEIRYIRIIKWVSIYLINFKSIRSKWTNNTMSRYFCVLSEIFNQDSSFIISNPFHENT